MTVREQLDEIRHIDLVLERLKRDKPQNGSEEFFLWETLVNCYTSCQNMLIMTEGRDA